MKVLYSNLKPVPIFGSMPTHNSSKAFMAATVSITYDIIAFISILSGMFTKLWTLGRNFSVLCGICYFCRIWTIRNSL